MISSLEHLNIVQHPLDLSAAVDTTAEAATSSFGGQAVSFPILAAGRLSAAAEVPTQEVYRDLISIPPQRHELMIMHPLLLSHKEIV